MSWTPQNLNDSIRRGEIYPLYFFYGDETFLIDDTMSLLEPAVLDAGLRDFNFNTYCGDDADIEVVREAIETFPMMARARMVVLKEAQDLSDKDWEHLMPLIESPVESCVLVCIATKIDKRKKQIKRILERGVAVEFKRPFDTQVPEWIQYIARKQGLQISRDGVALLHQIVGSNLTDINGELQKLAQYIGGQRTNVTVEDISRVVSRLRLDSVFDLTDAIGGNDRARALFCLANLLEHGQNEVGVLSLISRHVRILKLVNDGIKNGLSGQRLSQRAGISSFFLKQYIEQTRHWKEQKIESTFQALLHTDRALKSSPVPAHFWLENLIVQTCTA